ncbi:MAG TPA: tRNA 2-selenouridine(34) synthase MnmH [Cyclobacteriaceae bacterium]|nr:tRNA 2-selenouridine(34) synthase MnmH [Cyclobacteriaceae bacterium]
MERQAVDIFLTNSSSIPLLDVRSPGEYKVGHIPSASSFPLFTDEERAVIGTLYKTEGRNSAIKKGLEIVGPTMTAFIEGAESFGSPVLALYCWRGGMRSESMAWLMERYGFQAIVLEGGYKAYRNHLLSYFNQCLPLKVITGYTGSKKTSFLHILRERGEQIIDLEGLAQHQGSSFGNKKSHHQPSTEHFQNLLFAEFSRLDLNKPIWIEDECMRIGQVNLPENLFHQMSKSPHIFLDVAAEQRIDFLLEDYGSLTREELVDATEGIRRKLGPDKAERAIQYLHSGELRKAAEIILTYYDVRYRASIEKKKHLVQEYYKISLEELPALASKLAIKNIHAI